MHVNDGPRVLHVTNVGITLDVSGSGRATQLEGHPRIGNIPRTALRHRESHNVRMYI